MPCSWLLLTQQNDLMLLSGPVFDKSVDRPSHSVFLFHFYISNYATGKRPFIGANMGIKKSVFENIKFASELKRGDDSLFYLQCKSLVNFNHRYLENAVVHNDFPICYIDWIRNTFREGYCGGKILSCSNNNIFINIKCRNTFDKSSKKRSATKRKSYKTCPIS